ncbi:MULTISPECIES: MBL fold metallo-hydrolase [Bacillaceae]|uniref:Pyrroloquinoline quinone biosynthesis protein B n=1 Tax=Peribacillus huizhouensis TaxID=1501239 RepID=A0ABR6CUJ5_9BACI|nr:MULTISPECIES: MBL fold metallo-hydrolase [Bacillaceae]MBA9028697.1 pyrroloquinoline quinone biosynthesis protein B [Peribacillus huizhouensis]
MSEVIVNIIGTAQDAGVPHPNCFCKNCLEAIKDSKYRRFAASLAIILPKSKEWHLIDATPDLREQMASIQMKYELQKKLMNSIWLTHAHIGHYPGLMFLGKEAIGSKGTAVYCGGKMKQLLENHAPWKQLVDLENIAPIEIKHEHSTELTPIVRITPVEVPHRNEFSETFAFWIEGPTRKLLYIPDIDRWDEWDHDIYEMAKEADICLLDGTFYSIEEIERMGRDYKEIPHPVMTETMDRLQGLVEETAIYFTHFNHSNPVIDPESPYIKQVKGRGFHIAVEGMEILL